MTYFENNMSANMANSLNYYDTENKLVCKITSLFPHVSCSAWRRFVHHFSWGYISQDPEFNEGILQFVRLLQEKISSNSPSENYLIERNILDDLLFSAKNGSLPLDQKVVSVCESVFENAYNVSMKDAKYKKEIWDLHQEVYNLPSRCFLTQGIFKFLSVISCGYIAENASLDHLTHRIIEVYQPTLDLGSDTYSWHQSRDLFRRLQIFIQENGGALGDKVREITDRNTTIDLLKVLNSHHSSLAQTMQVINTYNFNPYETFYALFGDMNLNKALISIIKHTDLILSYKTFPKQFGYLILEVCSKLKVHTVDFYKIIEKLIKDKIFENQFILNFIKEISSKFLFLKTFLDTLSADEIKQLDFGDFPLNDPNNPDQVSNRIRAGHRFPFYLKSEDETLLFSTFQKMGDKDGFPWIMDFSFFFAKLEERLNREECNESDLKKIADLLEKHFSIFSLPGEFSKNPLLLNSLSSLGPTIFRYFLRNKNFFLACFNGPFFIGLTIEQKELVKEFIPTHCVHIAKNINTQTYNQAEALILENLDFDHKRIFFEALFARSDLGLNFKPHIIQLFTKIDDNNQLLKHLLNVKSKHSEHLVNTCSFYLDYYELLSPKQKEIVVELTLKDLNSLLFGLSGRYSLLDQNFSRVMTQLETSERKIDFFKIVVGGPAPRCFSEEQSSVVIKMIGHLFLENAPQAQTVVSDFLQKELSLFDVSTYYAFFIMGYKNLPDPCQKIVDSHFPVFMKRLFEIEPSQLAVGAERILDNIHDTGSLGDFYYNVVNFTSNPGFHQDLLKILATRPEKLLVVLTNMTASLKTQLASLMEIPEASEYPQLQQVWSLYQEFIAGKSYDTLTTWHRILESISKKPKSIYKLFLENLSDDYHLSFLHVVFAIQDDWISREIEKRKIPLGDTQLLFQLFNLNILDSRRQENLAKIIFPDRILPQVNLHKYFNNKEHSDVIIEYAIENPKNPEKKLICQIFAHKAFLYMIPELSPLVSALKVDASSKELPKLSLNPLQMNLVLEAYRQQVPVPMSAKKFDKETNEEVIQMPENYNAINLMIEQIFLCNGRNSKMLSSKGRTCQIIFGNKEAEVEKISLTSLFNNPLFSDITLKIDDKVIYAHKVVLAAFSDYFNSMFSIGMSESSSNEIEIQEITSDVIEYIYTSVQPKYQGTAEEILDQQTYFQDCFDQLNPMAPLVGQKDPFIELEDVKDLVPHQPSICQ
ncbi:MAG: BTB/POZ domain-containing protein [Parachlamydiales bacterium]|jgi:hypothetical protein